MPQPDEFLQSLRATFMVEARELLQAISAGLRELEKNPPPEEPRHVIEQVFRAAHSLKGAARAVNFTEIESTCQSLEDHCAAWKRQSGLPSPRALDEVRRALDAVAEIVIGPAVPAATPPPSMEPGAAISPSEVPESGNRPEAVITPAETVRIPVAKLDARLREAEELLAAKLATSQRAFDLRELAMEFAAWNKEWTAVQPDGWALRQILDRPETKGGGSPALHRMLEFLAWNADFFSALQSRVSGLTQAAEQDRASVGKLVDDLVDGSKKLLMLPLSGQSAFFQKLVRDLCRDQGKEADLVIRGEDVEIDKRILEEMKDPLVHMLRNCVDHGIEKPEVRRQFGKPPRATIQLTVSPVNGNKVELAVSDDGAGIDPRMVRESAIKQGILSERAGAELGEEELLDLIFRADVSTSPTVTPFSGRGLGLAIVQEKTEKLNGRVTVESRRHVGTTIRMALPVMLATFRGILVEVENRSFVIPTVSVERVGHFRPEEVQTVEGRETIAPGGRTVALVRLADVLELPPADAPAGKSAATPFVVLGSGEGRVAFAVDAVIDEREVSVKPLQRPLSRLRNVAAATILASGQVVPILNVTDLLKSIRKTGGGARSLAEAKPVKAAIKSILVAEDSITSRMLVKGILECAGYRVKTAVDGAEAFATLRADCFDLVVSDVEMPRLNGFDLTTRIRADKKLAELPVILVTALESREDRERGIDVGANAYLVKSSFDQSNLLEAVRRLI